VSQSTLRHYCVVRPLCVRSFVCCVSFDRGVILCDVCYLFVVSYCKPLPPGKNQFAVNKYYITLHYITLLRICTSLQYNTSFLYTHLDTLISTEKGKSILMLY
jgi:hypothetical protein